MARNLLRLEGGFVLIGAVLAYWALGGPWLAFGVLFLAPDLSFTAYAVSRRAGTVFYNMAHTYLGPALLAAGAVVFVRYAAVIYGVAPVERWQYYSPYSSILVRQTPIGLNVAVIWVAHIGLDRLLGVGLKYTDSGKETHIQRV